MANAFVPKCRNLSVQWKQLAECLPISYRPLWCHGFVPLYNIPVMSSQGCRLIILPCIFNHLYNSDRNTGLHPRTCSHDHYPPICNTHTKSGLTWEIFHYGSYIRMYVKGTVAKIHVDQYTNQTNYKLSNPAPALLGWVSYFAPHKCICPCNRQQNISKNN